MRRRAARGVGCGFIDRDHHRQSKAYSETFAQIRVILDFLQ